MTPTHEEIRLVVPIGSPGWVFEYALRAGRRFATEFGDRPAGPRHGVIYTCTSSAAEAAFLVYWTPALRVVVRAEAIHDPA